MATRNREEEREYNRRYYREHREKILKRSIENMRRYRAENRDWLRESKRKYDLRYCAINKEKLARKFREYQSRQRDIWMQIIHERGIDKCSRCGYDKCFAAIDFHHRNPKEKKFNIGNLLQRPVTEERLGELEKTIPLCSNCHREIEYSLKRKERELCQRDAC